MSDEHEPATQLADAVPIESPTNPAQSTPLAPPRFVAVLAFIDAQFDLDTRLNRTSLSFEPGTLRLAFTRPRPDGSHEVGLAFRPEGWAESDKI